MAKATKGIRISDLAKDLGVTAKSILEKIHAEGIESQKDYKTSSSIPLGLAETVKEWKTAGELKAADDSNVAVAERPKRASSKKKKEVAPAEAQPAVAEAPVVDEPVADAPPDIAPHLDRQGEANVADETAAGADQAYNETEASPESEASAGDDARPADAPAAKPRQVIKPVQMTPGAAQTRGPNIVAGVPPKRAAAGQGMDIAFTPRPPSAPGPGWCAERSRSR